MKVKTQEIRDIALRLLAHLEETGNESIEIDVDYYWNIPAAIRYDPYARPAELDLGQLSDNMQELRRIAGGESEPINYAFVWLAAVLRRIGEQAQG